jgi:hypothetical protein
MADRRDVRVEILDVAAVDDMAGKVQSAAGRPEMNHKVRTWREKHRVTTAKDGYSFAVVGETLMYLHRAPDGMIIPHASYPDGTEKVYTDHDHAEAAYG